MGITHPRDTVGDQQRGFFPAKYFVDLTVTRGPSDMPEDTPVKKPLQNAVPQAFPDPAL